LDVSSLENMFKKKTDHFAEHPWVDLPDWIDRYIIPPDFEFHLVLPRQQE